MADHDYDFTAERRFFETQRAALAAKHLGKYVVVTKDQVVGVVDDYEAALELGFRSTGGPWFLARRVTKEPEPETLPACLLLAV